MLKRVGLLVNIRLGCKDFARNKKIGLFYRSVSIEVKSLKTTDIRVFTLPAPVYHWAGWDGHTGGVTDIHLDSWSLIAVNACKHQVRLNPSHLVLMISIGAMIFGLKESVEAISTLIFIWCILLVNNLEFCIGFSAHR